MSYAGLARPEDLEALPAEAPIADPHVAALNRIAVALEQIALALLDAQAPKLAPLPPVQPVAQRPVVAPVQPPLTQPVGVCPAHQLPWKFVPAGTNRNGVAYNAFWACQVRGCTQRPPQ